MTDTTPEAVERNICNPIISHVHDGRGLSEKRCGKIIDTARALVAENERLRADLANAVTVKVKPLEWEKDPRNVSFIDAEYVDDFGLYCIAERVLFIGHTETGIRFGTVKEAKAAAQADYERRILSALANAPSPGQPATEQPPAVRYALESGAVDALASYQQADEEGVMVLVSRQAADQCVAALRALEGSE